MGKGYPGETNDELPKRICDTLQNQPINYLIPKTGLSKLISSSIRQELHMSKVEAFMNPSSTDWSYPFPIDFDPLNDGDADPITFKRPTHMNLEKSTESDEKDLKYLKRLPQLGIRCLTVASLVDSDRIVSDLPRVKNENCSKRKADFSEDDIIFTDASDKRAKMLVQSTAMNDVEVGNRYVGHFTELVTTIGITEKDIDYNNVQFWKLLGNQFICTSEAIDRISISVNKLLNFPKAHEAIDIAILRNILEVCNRNIVHIEKYAAENEGNTHLDLNGLAFNSACLILEIMMVNTGKSHLQMEQHFSLVFTVVSNIVESLKDFDSSKDISQQVQELSSFINLLQRFIHSQPYLDDMLLIKCICVGCDLLVHKSYQFLNTTAILAQVDSIKEGCLRMLVSLFSRYPSQRVFMIEELVSHAHDLALTKSSRKLKLIDSRSNVHASYFTVTLVLMLQSVHSTMSAAKAVLDTDELWDNFDLQDTLLSSQFSELVETVTSSLYQIATSSASKFKSTMEIFTQDLVSMLPNPDWIPCHILLGSLLSKLFQIFNPAHQNATSFDVPALHMIGQITAAMVDLRNSAEKKSAYNVSGNELLDQYMYCIRCLKRDGSLEAANSLFSGAIHCCNDVNNSETEKKLTLKMLIRGIEDTEEFEDSFIEEGLSAKKELSSYAFIISKSTLFQLFEPALRLILSLLDQNKVKLKSSAVKCLNLLVLRDPHMVKTSFVRDTITNRLYDSSASVRDAILDLLEQTSTHLEFYKDINHHYNDDSVAVRKHVLRINELIADKANELNIKVFVFEKIIRRFEDEEDVIVESARNFVLKKLFVSDKNDPRSSQDIEESLEILSTLVTESKKSSELLEFFLNFYVLNSSQHDEQLFSRILLNFRHMTDKLVDSIIENTLELDSDDYKLIAKAELLLFFANCPGCLLSKENLYSLSHYLISSNRGRVFLTLLKVFRTCLKKLNNLKSKFLTELEKGLLLKLSKINTKEIEEVLAICWEISVKREDDTKLLKVCNSCINQLRPYVNQAVSSPASMELDGKIQRLIYLSTGLARLCHFNEEDGSFDFLKNGTRLYQYVTKCLLAFSNIKLPPSLTRIAIKNIVKLASSYPKLFNSPPVLKVLDNALNCGKLETKLSVIECFQDFFASEEKKVLMKAGVHGTVSSNASLRKLISTQNTSESVNDGVCSALVTRYLDSILDLCLLRDIKHSSIPLKFLELTLNFNYVNPSHTVPTLITLLCSKSNRITGLATKLLSKIFEQYESMVFNGIATGLKKSATFVKESTDTNDSCLQRLQILVSNNKRNSTKFLAILKNIIVAECYSYNSEGNDDLRFLLTNLYTLEFGDQFELCDMLSSISLAMDELDETIQDILSVQAEDKRYEKAFSLIQRRGMMSVFKTSMMRHNTLSSEKLSYIGTPDESLLKGKSVNKSSISNFDTKNLFGKQFAHNFPEKEMEKRCHEYQQEYDNTY